MNHQALVGAGSRYLLETEEREGAINTVRDFWQSIDDKEGLAIGLVKTNTYQSQEQEDEIEQELDDLSQETGLPIYLWDETSRKQLQQSNELVNETLFMPYGGIPNQIALLGLRTGSDAYVRLDRDCNPRQGTSLDDIITEHLGLLEDNAIVSAQYEPRYALTDEFIAEEDREEWYNFVEKWTGIDTRQQLNGGGAFTMSLASLGIPAPTFSEEEGYFLVWGSDDAYLGRVAEQKGEDWTTSDSKIIQQPDPDRESQRYFKKYFPRVAANACLHECTKQQRTGSIDEEAVTETYHDFIADFVDQQFISEETGEVVDNPPESENLPAIVAEGFDCYQAIVGNWDKIAADAKKSEIKAYD